MMKHTTTLVGAAAALTLAGTLAACGGDATQQASDAAAARGPIEIWYSNNEQEIAWGKQMTAAWNADHPNEKITAQEIPAGKSSEEVIGAAITAGNAPCLIYNTSPASVSQFVKQGGLVPLDDFPDGRSYAEQRGGSVVDQYQSADGKLYQLPWKSNPVMIFYNKDVFKKAGLDPENPQLSTYDDFLASARKIVDSGAADYAIWPSPTSEFYQSWFDFYPLFAAETGGTQLVEDGKAQFDSEAGIGVASFWRTMYDEGLASQEASQVDSFAEGQAAMAIVGPWAVAVYGKDVNWGVVPVPTSQGTPAADTWTFSDAKNVAMYSACENRGTAWDVMKFSTSKEWDGKLLDLSGQMPIRTGLQEAYADYFKANPDYTTFADQASRTVEVPNVSNSIEMWQTFRDAWTSSVIFGKEDVQSALSAAADKIDSLVSEG